MVNINKESTISDIHGYFILWTQIKSHHSQEEASFDFQSLILLIFNCVCRDVFGAYVDRNLSLMLYEARVPRAVQILSTFTILVLKTHMIWSDSIYVEK